MGRALKRSLTVPVALALPALVAASCLVPLLGLALQDVSQWLGAALAGMLAVGICAAALRERGVGVAASVGFASVVMGSGAFALVLRGLSALGDSQDQAVIDRANSIVTAIPFALAALALFAVGLTIHALPESRVSLGIAWLLAIATPFALFGPVFALSEGAGNAGMDVVALFVMPVAAFLIWPLLVVLLLVADARTARRQEDTGATALR